LDWNKLSPNYLASGSQKKEIKVSNNQNKQKTQNFNFIYGRYGDFLMAMTKVQKKLKFKI